MKLLKQMEHLYCGLFCRVAAERNDDILQGYIFEKSDDEDENVHRLML